MEEKRKRGLQNVVIDIGKIQNKTFGEVFGIEVISITTIMQRLWALIKNNNLRISNKKEEVK